jgi:hypothetical protein
MGLDMYLSVREFISKTEYYTDENGGYASKPNQKYEDIVNAIDMFDTSEFSGGGSVSVMTTVGYWRKANAIHGWFVNNLAGGLDECQEIHVPRNALVDLLAACKAVMSVSVAESKQDVADEFGLNPTEGFFFGGYELDEYYDEDIKYTIKMIEYVLENTSPQKTEFVYQASW